MLTPRNNDYQFTQNLAYSNTPIATTSPGSTQDLDPGLEQNTSTHDIGSSPLPPKKESGESEGAEKETQSIQSQSREMPPPIRRGTFAGDTAPRSGVGAPYSLGNRGRGGGRGFPEQKLVSERGWPRNSRHGDGPQNRFRDTSTSGQGTFPWSRGNDRVPSRRVRFEDNERGGDVGIDRFSSGIGSGRGRPLPVQDHHGRDNYSRAKRGGFNDRQSYSGFSPREGPRFRNLIWKFTPQDNEGPQPSGVDGDGDGDGGGGGGGDGDSGSGSGSGLPRQSTSARSEQHYSAERSYPHQMMARGSQERRLDGNSEERTRDAHGFWNQEGGRREAQPYMRGEDLQSRDRNRGVPGWGGRTWDRGRNLGTNGGYRHPERDWGDRGTDSRRFPPAVSRTQWGPSREEGITYTERSDDYRERRRSLSPDRHDRRSYELENRRRYEYENKRSNEYENKRGNEYGNRRSNVYESGRKDYPVNVSRVYNSINERKRDYHSAANSHSFSHTASYGPHAVSPTEHVSFALTKPVAVKTRMGTDNAQHKATAINYPLIQIPIPHDSHPHQEDKQLSPLMDSANYTLSSPVPRDELPGLPVLPVPKPTASYMIAAHEDPTPVLTHLPPPPILVILDLNGTLLYRSKRPQMYLSSKHPRARPYLRQFLQYLFSHFHVMIWSSAQPHNVAAMISATFSPEQREKLVAVWARDTLGLTPAQMRRKIVVYKCLDKVWEKLGVEKKTAGGATAAASDIDSSNSAYSGDDNDEKVAPGPWGQHNTILIDDSAVKATAQPYNLVEISSWEGGFVEDRALVEAAGYLEELRRGKWSDVSAYMRAKPFRIDDGWGSNEKVGEWFWGEDNRDFPEGKVAGKKALKKAKRNKLEMGLQMETEQMDEFGKKGLVETGEGVVGEGAIGLRDDFSIGIDVARLARESTSI